MSSTAICAKQLAVQGELTTRHGRASIGVLLFQDMATIPLLAALPLLGGASSRTPVEIGIEVMRLLVILSTLAVLAKPLCQRALIWIARHGHAEAFLLTSVLIVLGTAWGAHHLGVPPALGAFLTGLVLGESDFRHRIEDNIQPFRDLMLGLFFITVGMQLDTGVFAQAPFSVLLWLAILIPAKILVNGLALRLAKLNWLDAGRGAIILGHGGEFGLLLLSLAVSIGLLQMTIAQPILVAIAISMAAAPLLISTHDRVILALMNVDGQRHAQPEELEGIALSKSLQRHIVICGAGSLGRIVAKALSRADIPHILLEAHYRPYIRAKHDGLPVLYGDASRIGTLQAVGAARAVAVVIAFHHLKPALRTVRALRHQFPKLPLIASVRGEAAAEAFSAVEGVRVFQEEVAAGIALAAQCLSDAGLSPDRVGSLLSELSFELDSD